QPAVRSDGEHGPTEPGGRSDGSSAAHPHPHPSRPTAGADGDEPAPGGDPADLGTDVEGAPAGARLLVGGVRHRRWRGLRARFVVDGLDNLRRQPWPSTSGWATERI